METIETYLDEIAAAGAGKIIISKPANKSEEYKKIVIEKKESYFQAAAYTHKSRCSMKISEWRNWALI